MAILHLLRLSLILATATAQPTYSPPQSPTNPSASSPTAPGSSSSGSSPPAVDSALQPSLNTSAYLTPADFAASPDGFIPFGTTIYRIYGPGLLPITDEFRQAAVPVFVDQYTQAGLPVDPLWLNITPAVSAPDETVAVSLDMVHLFAGYASLPASDNNASSFDQYQAVDAFITNTWSITSLFPSFGGLEGTFDRQYEAAFAQHGFTVHVFTVQYIIDEAALPLFAKLPLPILGSYSISVQLIGTDVSPFDVRKQTLVASTLNNLLQSDSAAATMRVAQSWDISEGEIEVCRRPSGSSWVLGEGSFGMVFRAVRGGIHDVAVKILTHADAEQLQQFRKEISILKSLSFNRNIVQFYGACLQAGKPMLVLEYMEGGDLRQAMASARGAELRWCRKGQMVALDIARGLHFLHTHKVMHSDLKTGNVLLTRDFHCAKIGDVGLARIMSSQYLSMTASVGGTFAYAAPELLLNQRCSEKVDIYSFGIVLHEMVTGEQAQRGQLREVKVPEECPDAIAKLIDNCLELDPARRPTAKEVFYLIRDSLDHGPEAAPARPVSSLATDEPTVSSDPENLSGTLSDRSQSSLVRQMSLQRSRLLIPDAMPDAYAAFADTETSASDTPHASWEVALGGLHPETIDESAEGDAAMTLASGIPFPK
ncbi:hypothetical protein WJX72_001765 [[Myrmecia] bisecta]|uniref:Protein kinase domain-containing protein n=1 Tax=[Myrmecia] bisecta TaxID=41462 RepID=A0AAW1PAY3_9CHLO